MHAPAKPDDVPFLTDPAVLTQYDAFLFGVPTRYGNFPAQWKVSQELLPLLSLAFISLLTSTI